MTDGLEFRFAAELVVLRALRQDMREGLVGIGVDGADLERLLLVMDEIASNAIEHGGDYRASSEPLTARLTMRDGRVLVEFEDADTPLDTVMEVARDFGDAAEADVPPALMLERGRGMFLVNEFLQDLEVKAINGDRGMLLQGWLELD